MRFYLVAILFGLLGLFGCGDASDPTLPNNYTPLTSIEITAANPQIANLTSTQLRAIGNFSGLFTRDISADVLWTSADPTVASVSNAVDTIGRVTGLSPGSTSISAFIDGVPPGLASLTVTNATLSTLTIAPLAPIIPKGLTSQFQATGTFSDATSQDLSFDVSWDSSDPLVATIGNAAGSKGLATAVAIGSSSITAAFAGVSASTLMTVSGPTLNTLTLSPLTPSILNLSSGQFTATGTFSDASTLDITDQVNWASSFPAIAAISNTTGSQGQVSTLIEGFTTISASMDGISADTRLSVTGGNLSAINVLPKDSNPILLDPIIPVTMSAEGVFGVSSRDISTEVTWSSSVPTVASIDSQGVVTTVRSGTTEIKAVNGTISGRTNLTVVATTFRLGSLIVTPATSVLATLASNTSQKFTASGAFNDGSIHDLTADVIWSSADPAVATISNATDLNGVATGVARGTASVTADFRGLGSDSSRLSVTEPTLISVDIDTLPTTILPGRSLQLKATAIYLNAPNQDITADVAWTSADTSVAIFMEAVTAPGEIWGVDTGSVEITATFGGKSDKVTLVVP